MEIFQFFPIFLFIIFIHFLLYKKIHAIDVNLMHIKHSVMELEAVIRCVEEQKNRYLMSVVDKIDSDRQI